MHIVLLCVCTALPCISYAATSLLGLLNTFASPAQLLLFHEWSDISIHDNQASFLFGFTNIEH